ncbi:MAG: hypothetical protein H6926_02495 [Chromatiales bacterium]|nr:hypothetical protein [Chromatiales bacterium]
MSWESVAATLGLVAGLLSGLPMVIGKEGMQRLRIAIEEWYCRLAEMTFHDRVWASVDKVRELAQDRFPRPFGRETFRLVWKLSGWVSLLLIVFALAAYLTSVNLDRVLNKDGVTLSFVEGQLKFMETVPSYVIDDGMRESIVELYAGFRNMTEAEFKTLVIAGFVASVFVGYAAIFANLLIWTFASLGITLTMLRQTEHHYARRGTVLFILFCVDGVAAGLLFGLGLATYLINMFLVIVPFFAPAIVTDASNAFAMTFGIGALWIFDGLSLAPLLNESVAIREVQLMLTMFNDTAALGDYLKNEIGFIVANVYDTAVRQFLADMGRVFRLDLLSITFDRTIRNWSMVLNILPTFTVTFMFFGLLLAGALDHQRRWLVSALLYADSRNEEAPAFLIGVLVISITVLVFAITMASKGN